MQTSGNPQETYKQDKSGEGMVIYSLKPCYTQKGADAKATEQGHQPGHDGGVKF